MEKKLDLELLSIVPDTPPFPDLLEYYLGLQSREIWLDTDVEVEEGAVNIVKQIIRWNREDRELSKEIRRPIILYCFSYGGDLDVCNMIIDAIQASRTPVIAVNAGRCMSAAAYIYISCPTRYMFEHAYFLFHQGSGVVAGTNAEMKAQMDNYNKQVEELTKLMQKYTTYNEEEIKKNITTEWYVSAKEAIENGVSGKVITDLDEVIA